VSLSSSASSSSSARVSWLPSLGKEGDVGVVRDLFGLNRGAARLLILLFPFSYAPAPFPGPLDRVCGDRGVGEVARRSSAGEWGNAVVMTSFTTEGFTRWGRLACRRSRVPKFLT
jgi:hypothetical protein